MAIYHLSASIVKRSAGRSVTAAAAYRAAEKIEDLSTGIIYDYTRKQGVDYSVILSPISANLSNEWLTNRQKLWNKVEEVEKQKNAQLGREITIALPKELSRSEQIALVCEFTQTNYVSMGMIADINLHHLDGDNPHAHILLSMRDLQTSPAGVVEFGLKNRDWNNKELLITQRKSWEEITNKYLAASGSNIKIDCRSLKDQGSQFIPQIHVGVHAMAMYRKGLQTDRGEEFDRIEAANNDIRDRLERAYQEESTEPEIEVKQELTEQQKQQIAADRKLAELIIQVMPLNSRETQTFGIYRIKPCINGFDVRINNSTIILKLKLEDDTWAKSIRYPIKGDQRKHHYSNSDIDAKADDFVKTIENHLQRIDELKIEAEAEKQRVKAEAQARQAERQRAEAEARAREIDKKRAKAEAKILAIEERKLAREQLKIEIKQREIEEYQARLAFQRLIIEERKLAEDENRHKNDELGRSLDSLLKKWGQRVFFPEDIELTFYRIHSDQISVYIHESQPMATRVYSLKLIDDSWIDVLDTNKHKYSVDILTTLVNNQHDRFDTGEIKRLELNYKELNEIPDFKAWRGLELNDYRLTRIRERGIEIITTDLAEYLGEWIKENIPETDDILTTKNKPNEIIDDSSDSVILINCNPPNSVYTYYILFDRKENQSLEIRYNRDRFERIGGIITPLISERIKNIINDLESIGQEQELISPESIDINLEPVTALSAKELTKQQPSLDQEKLEESETREPTLAIEKIETIVIEEDRVVENEQPIKVVEILQPQTVRQTRKRLDRGGR